MATTVNLSGLQLDELPSWLYLLPPGMLLTPGVVAPKPLVVPVGDANKLLAQTVRLVADLPAGVSGDVVWTRGTAELLVKTGGVKLACAPGVVTVAVPVSCDQLGPPATMHVALAVGSEDRPAGLVMSAFSRCAGPDVVGEQWSEALTAFAWEALLHLAQELCGATGKDKAGRPLVPASIAATKGALLLQPMARHELSSPAAKVKP
jgi:hypothetical protein